jgi:hypothetical protein
MFSSPKRYLPDKSYYLFSFYALPLPGVLVLKVAKVCPKIEAGADLLTLLAFFLLLLAFAFAEAFVLLSTTFNRSIT